MNPNCPCCQHGFSWPTVVDTAGVLPKNFQVPSLEQQQRNLEAVFPNMTFEPFANQRLHDFADGLAYMPSLPRLKAKYDDSIMIKTAYPGMEYNRLIQIMMTLYQETNRVTSGIAPRLELKDFEELHLAYPMEISTILVYTPGEYDWEIRSFNLGLVNQGFSAWQAMERAEQTLAMPMSIIHFVALTLATHLYLHPSVTVLHLAGDAVGKHWHEQKCPRIYIHDTHVVSLVDYRVADIGAGVPVFWL